MDQFMCASLFPHPLLTESSFVEHCRGDEQEEMDSISRQIVVRMEVIAKQIAFLSKETSGRTCRLTEPRGVVESANGAGVESQRDAPPEGLDGRSRDGAVNSGIQRSSDSDGPIQREGGATASSPVVESASVVGELDRRIDLHRRIRLGQASASELLPSGMLSQTLRQQCSSEAPPPPSLGHAGGLTADLTSLAALHTSAISSPSPCGEPFGRRREKRGTERDEVVPPGLLHQFIKHVVPFSICRLETSKGSLGDLGPGAQSKPTPNSDRSPNMTTPTGNVNGGACNPDESALGRDSCAEAPLTEAPSRGKGSEGVSMDADMVQDGPQANSLGHRQSPPSDITGRDSAVDGPAYFVNRWADDGESRGCIGAPRKAFPSSSTVVVVGDRSPAVCTPGKRRLNFSRIPTGGGSRATAAVPAAPSATSRGDARDPEARGVAPHRKTKAPFQGPPGRKDAKKNTINSAAGSGSRPCLLSWRAAKDFRQRMEGAAASHRRVAHAPGASGRKVARGVRSNRGANQTLDSPDPMGGISSFFSIGSLSLVHPYTHLELPEIKSVDDYLVSLANPARDLAAMKTAFCEGPRWNSSPTGTTKRVATSVEPSDPGGCPDDALDSEFDGVAPDDRWDCPSEEEKAEVRLTAALESSGDDLRTTPGSPGQSAARVATGSGTCMIDLKNIWQQRSGAVSSTPSQAWKALEARTGVADELCKAFSRLDVDHREETPRAPEALFSVSLGEPSHDLNGGVPAPAHGGEEGPARRFALVVSMTHAHNISTSAASQHSAEGGGSVEGGAEHYAPPQLKLEVATGGDGAKIVAVRGE